MNFHFMIFEVLTLLQIQVLWDVKLCHKGQWFLMFQRLVVPSSSIAKWPKENLLGLLDP